VRIDEIRLSFLKNRWFWLSLFFFTCSLLSRAWGITLPLILLVLDIYPLRRVQLKAIFTRAGRWILIEKIAFVLIALVFAVLALLAKQSSMVSIAKHGPLERMLQSFYGLCFYPWKTLVPANLSPLYLLHDVNAADGTYILCAVVVVLGTGLLIVSRQQWPWALSGWVCYGIIISPQLGIVQSGPQVVADRYSYFACLPFAILFAAGIRLGCLRLREHCGPRKGPVTLLVITALALLWLGGVSHRQMDLWRDNLSFWDHIIQHDPLNFIAANERARLKFEELGDFAGAAADYDHVLALNPEYGDALVNRGLVRLELRQYKAAAADLKAAQVLEGPQAEIENGCGLLAFENGDRKKALRHYNRAISLRPKFSDVYINRGLLFKTQGGYAAALADFDTALRMTSDSPEAYANRGAVYQAQDNISAAIFDFESALIHAPVHWPERPLVQKNLRRLYRVRDAGTRPTKPSAAEERQ